MIGATTRARRRWQLARHWQARGDLTEAAGAPSGWPGTGRRPPLLAAEILLTAAEVHRDLATTHSVAVRGSLASRSLSPWSFQIRFSRVA